MSSESEVEIVYGCESVWDGRTSHYFDLGPGTLKPNYDRDVDLVDFVDSSNVRHRVGKGFCRVGNTAAAAREKLEAEVRAGEAAKARLLLDLEDYFDQQ